MQTLWGVLTPSWVQRVLAPCRHYEGSWYRTSLRFGKRWTFSINSKTIDILPVFFEPKWSPNLGVYRALPALWGVFDGTFKKLEIPFTLPPRVDFRCFVSKSSNFTPPPPQEPLFAMRKPNKPSAISWSWPANRVTLLPSHVTTGSTTRLRPMSSSLGGGLWTEFSQNIDIIPGFWSWNRPNLFIKPFFFYSYYGILVPPPPLTWPAPSAWSTGESSSTNNSSILTSIWPCTATVGEGLSPDYIVYDISMAVISYISGRCDTPLPSLFLLFALFGFVFNPHVFLNS